MNDKVISLFDRPEAWKQVFQAECGDVTVHVYVNRMNGASQIVLVNDEGEAITANMQTDDTFAMVNHLTKTLDRIPGGHAG